MVVAAFGYIPPLVGAFIQEAIDVAVIVNALRAAKIPRQHDTMHSEQRVADSPATAGPGDPETARRD
jgi:hypothetical protein